LEKELDIFRKGSISAIIDANLEKTSKDKVKEL
jgi:hypothetical protein